MTPEHWQRLEELFHEVLAQPELERGRFLRQASQGDGALQREIEALVLADQRAGGYMEWTGERGLADILCRAPYPRATAEESRATSSTADPGAAGDGRRGAQDHVPETVGPYRLLQIRGEGGMGTVFLARQTEPIKRDVALKLLRPGLMERQTVLRFQAEGQALARMHHPNIAQVFEAGTTAGGQPYLVMEYIPGLAITEYCDRGRKSIRQRLELFTSVCEGVQHLHQKALIHRDIKPSNILVMEEGGRPIPKIIDFGIAKALDHPLTDETLRTGDHLLGTPAYLSPEALDAPAGGTDIDTRCDVYALGVLLYELLTGVLPFGGRGEALRQVLHRIAEDEARPPSVKLMALDPETRNEAARRRGAAASTLRRALSGDLDWITMKAMARQPPQRYASAAELAADVSRHLGNEPVSAGPPSPAYRMRKFIRRYRTTAAAVLLVVGALLTGIVLRTVEAPTPRREAEPATGEAEASRQLQEFLLSAFELSDPGKVRGSEITAREILDNAAQKVSLELEDQPLLRARFMDTIGTVSMKLGLYAQATPLLSQALATRLELLGEDHADVVSSLMNLANLKTEAGDYTAAEPLYRQALGVVEEVKGAQHPDVADIANNLARVFAIQGRHAAAESLFSRALGIWEKQRGDDHPDVALALNNLGLLHLEQGRHAEAQPLLERSLTIQEKTLGSDHPDVTLTQNNLAILYVKLGEYRRAESLHRRVLATRERLYGTHHPLVAASLNNLGEVYVKLGAYDTAEQSYGRCLEVAEATVGLAHSHVAYCFSGLGEVYAEQGRYAEAESHLRRALDIRQNAFGPLHPGVSQVKRSLAGLLRTTGREEEASALEAELGSVAGGASD